jgi:hypothetical protein
LIFITSIEDTFLIAYGDNDDKIAVPILNKAQVISDSIKGTQPALWGNLENIKVLPGNFYIRLIG